jgi:hypothetical protein
MGYFLGWLVLRDSWWVAGVMEILKHPLDPCDICGTRDKRYVSQLTQVEVKRGKRMVRVWACLRCVSESQGQPRKSNS